MTGAEHHYAEAERILADTLTRLRDHGLADQDLTDLIALAQVHATLAVSAELHEGLWALAAVIRGGQLP